MMMAKKYRLGLVTLVGLLLLSGLVGFVRAQNSNDTLSLWGRYDADFAQPLIDAYNAQLKAQGKSIVLTYTKVDEADLSAKLANGQSPDVLVFDLVDGPKFTAQDAFLDLTARVTALDYRGQLNKVMLNLGTRNEKVYALPAIADVSLLLYNKKLFTDAGLDTEKALESWDTLRSAAQQLTYDKVVGYSLWCGNAGWLMYSVMPYVWANGGSFLNADGTKAMLDNPKTIEAVQFLSDLHLKDHVTTPAETHKGCAQTDFPDSSPDFTKGTIAITPNSGSYMAYLIGENPELDIGVSVFPGKTAGSHSAFIGGDLVAIPTASKHPDEAWDFVQYILSQDVQVNILAGAGFVPVRSDLTDNKLTAADPRFKVLAEALAAGYVPYTTVYQDLYPSIQMALQAALNGDQPVSEALAAANVQMQQILDKQ
jgi:multiple sugar transport system substrate-binding protein